MQVVPSGARCKRLPHPLTSLARCLFHKAFRECMGDGRAYWSLRRKRPNVFHLKERNNVAQPRLI